MLAALALVFITGCEGRLSSSAVSAEGVGTWALSPSNSAPHDCVGDSLHGLTVSETIWPTNARIQVAGDKFVPEWTGATPPGVLMLESPSGTVLDDEFTSTWSYCYVYGGSITIKADWIWTGTLAADQKSFTSTLRETLTEAEGDQRFACASIALPMSACTAPGLSWQVDGVRQ